LERKQFIDANDITKMSFWSRFTLPSPTNRAPSSLPDLLRQIRASKRSVLLVHTPWCSACKTVVPAFEQASETLHTKLQFFLACSETMPAVKREFEIQTHPSILFFVNGVEVRAKRMSGLSSIDDFFKAVQSFGSIDEKKSEPANLKLLKSSQKTNEAPPKTTASNRQWNLRALYVFGLSPQRRRKNAEAWARSTLSPSSIGNFSGDGGTLRDLLVFCSIPNNGMSEQFQAMSASLLKAIGRTGYFIPGNYASLASSLGFDSQAKSFNFGCPHSACSMWQFLHLLTLISNKFPGSDSVNATGSLLLRIVQRLLKCAECVVNFQRGYTVAKRSGRLSTQQGLVAWLAEHHQDLGDSSGFSFLPSGDLAIFEKVKSDFGLGQTSVINDFLFCFSAKV